MSFKRLSLVLCLALLAACGDDTTSGGTDAGAADAAVEAGGAPCTTDDDCDDQLFCDGVETCKAGACVAGEPMVCHDSIACTIDACSERKRGCESLPPDLDGDGHYQASCMGEAGKALGDDCDDDDPLRFPGNIESCDLGKKDDDCDPKTFGDKDSDDDGFMDVNCCNAASDKKGAKLNCGDDCDDLKASVHPDAVEACDLYDNDCDANTDEGVSVKVYPDADRDGHGAIKDKKGDEIVPSMKCAGTVGFASAPNDCEDEDPEVFIGQFEICDKKDNNCDGEADEVHDDAPWFLDIDKDGFGDAASTPIYSCERIPGRVLSNNDCNDVKPAINPAATEACDAIDNDCSGTKNFKLGTNDFEDDDNDGVADDQCTGGADCNDTDPSTGDGLPEVCDKRDNDCDDAIDEETAQTVWYLDKDGDGWGIDQGTALARCEPIPGRAANLGDCDDFENGVHPTALESCNGVDDNCNSKKDEATDYQCGMENAVGFCKLGGCAVLSCYPGFGDTDLDPDNGCEGTVPIVSIGACPGASDAECDDSEYCNGKERCVANLCYAGTPVNCDASSNVLQGTFFIHNSLDIQTLAGIETITGDLTISASGLVNLTGLESLKTIGGNLIIDGDLGVGGPTANHSLVALVGSGLFNLTTVVGDIIIEDNSALTVIRLPSLVTAGSIRIRRNNALTTLDGFDDLVKVYGALEIDNDNILSEITGMQSLTSTGDLRIADNPQLEEIRLPALTRIRGDFNPTPGDESYDEAVKKIVLPKLTQIDGRLHIADMSALTTLSLPALKKVLGDELYISTCALLDDPDLHSLNTFTSADLDLGVEGTAYFQIGFNLGLTTLKRVTAVACPSGQCSASVYGNSALPNCDAANWLNSFTGFNNVSWYGNLPEQACPDSD